MLLTSKNQPLTAAIFAASGMWGLSGHESRADVNYRDPDTPIAQAP